MVDRISAESRSENMRRIRSKDTLPELRVRKLLYKVGYRYRLHRKKLPGRPDIVFSTRKKIIFIHGCFWHGHDGCVDGRTPKTNSEYWEKKLAGNRERDIKAFAALTTMGWRILVIWECCTNVEDTLLRSLTSFLGPVRR